MTIKERYEGKRILITGTTGFLGKVLLEKFLYSLSCVDKIYVLIRAKEGSNLLERFKKEIVSSRCFDRIRLQHKGRFDEFIQQKVQPMYASPHSARATFRRRVWDSRRRSSRNCAAAATWSSTAPRASISTRGSTSRSTATSTAPAGCSSWRAASRTCRCSRTSPPATSTATRADSSRRRSTTRVTVGRRRLGARRRTQAADGPPAQRAHRQHQKDTREVPQHLHLHQKSLRTPPQKAPRRRPPLHRPTRNHQHQHSRTIPRLDR